MRKLFLLPLFFTASNFAYSADWPVSRGNAAATGVGISKVDGELKVNWEFKAKSAIEGTPAIAGDVVFAASIDKHLYAVDAKTGQQKWKLDLKSPIKASPGVKNGKVYVGDVDGKFHCVDAKEGKLIWSFDANQEIASGCNFHGENIIFGSNDGNLYCLKPDKTLLWTFGIDQPINGSPSIVDDYTFIAGCDEVLHVIDLKTGKEVGKTSLGGPAGATAAVDAKIAYVGTMANQVQAMDLSDPKQPKSLWSFEAKSRQQPFYSSAAIGENSIFIGSRDKRIYALDKKTGKENWSIPTDGIIDGSPVIVGQKLYFGNMDTDGWFYVVDLKTGTIIQKLAIDSSVTSSPAVGENYILIGTEKGTLISLTNSQK